MFKKENKLYFDAHTGHCPGLLNQEKRIREALVLSGSLSSKALFTFNELRSAWLYRKTERHYRILLFLFSKSVLLEGLKLGLSRTIKG